MPRERLDVVEPADGLEEPALGRLDGSAIELDDARTGFVGALHESAQDTRLTDARDPVQTDHTRLVAQKVLQDAKLHFPADKGDPAPLRDRCGDERQYPPRRPRTPAVSKRSAGVSAASVEIDFTHAEPSAAPCVKRRDDALASAR